MTPEQKSAIEQLRSEGYAVVVFNPEELKGTNADHLEEILVERGENFIETMADSP